jgi:hypothetical protein
MLVSLRGVGVCVLNLIIYWPYQTIEDLGSERDVLVACLCLERSMHASVVRQMESSHTTAETEGQTRTYWTLDGK